MMFEIIVWARKTGIALSFLGIANTAYGVTQLHFEAQPDTEQNSYTPGITREAVTRIFTGSGISIRG